MGPVSGWRPQDPATGLAAGDTAADMAKRRGLPRRGAANMVGASGTIKATAWRRQGTKGGHPPDVAKPSFRYG
jgi:hypothetical protein